MLEVTVPTVYTWVKRYEENGIKGLETRPGQGRKPIMDCSDEEAVRKAIEEDRQSVSKAREAWQNATGKEASDITFKRFLETLVQDIAYKKTPKGNPHAALRIQEREVCKNLKNLIPRRTCAILCRRKSCLYKWLCSIWLAIQE